MSNPTLGKTYLSPNETSTVKQNSATRQLIEWTANPTSTGAASFGSITTTSTGVFNSVTVSSNFTAAGNVAFTALNGGILYEDNSAVGGTGLVHSSGQGVIAPGVNGIVGDGVTDDSTAWNNIINNFVEFVIFPGNYRLVTAGAVYGPGATYRFQTGATIKTTTLSLDFSGTHIEAPIFQRIFNLSGSGSVVGLGVSYPEWFGAARDGATDDSTSINQALKAVSATAANSRLGTGTCFLSQGNYFVGSNILAALPPAGTLRVQGGGNWGNPTTLTLSTALSGVGVTISATSQMNLQLKDFQIINKTQGTGASIGLQIGTTLAQLVNPSEQPGSVLLDHLYCAGFSNNLKFVNLGGGLVSNSQFWGLDSAGANTTNATHVLCTCAGGIGGTQVDFDGNILVNDNGASSQGISFNDGGTGGFVAGCRLNDNVFYSGTSGTQGILMVASGNNAAGGVLDMWVNSGNQFEGQAAGGAPGPAINILANGSSSLIQDIHVDHCYFSGQGWNTAIAAGISTGTGGVRNLFITSNFFLNPKNEAVIVSGFSSSTTGNMNGYTVCNNTIFTGVNCNDNYIFQNLIGDVVCNSNNVMVTGAPTITNGIALLGAGGKAVVVGNNTHAGTPVSTGSGSWTVSQNNNV